MTLSKICVALLVLASAPAWSDTVAELEEKIKKLEKQIESGTDPALVNPYLEKFRAELGAAKGSAPMAKPAQKPAPVAAKKTVVAKKRMNKKERQLQFLKTTSVEDRLDRYSVLHGLIKNAQAKLADLHNSGRSWRSIKREVTAQQDQIVEWQKEYDVLTESLGALRAIANISNHQSARLPKSDSSMAGSNKLKFNGHMQFRHENQNATGYDQVVTSAAKEGLSLFRLRGNFLYTPHEKLTVGFTPQAVKSLGGDEFSTSGAAANRQNESSGSTYQPQLDFFEAFVDYKISDNFSAKLGRQELAYGDHIVIGSLPWANDGRSFDALKFSYQHGKGKTDVFVSQISNDNTNADASDDSTFYGLYTEIGEFAIFKEFDLYALTKNDAGADNEINTFGFRFEGNLSGFFYRMESGVQQGLLANNRIEDGYQVDADLGYVAKSFNFKLGYAQAGTQYIQLFPTAHAFLGFADIFGRRNIVSYRAAATWMSNFGLSAHLFYHNFQRRDVNVVPYNLVNASFTNPAGSDAADLGSEIDLVIKQKFLKTSQIHFGAAIFTPGEYFKDQAADDADETRNFLYVQIISKF